MQANGTLCKLMELHASSGNCMKAHVTPCKLMDLHAFWNILHKFWNIQEHSACILDVIEGCRKDVDGQTDTHRQTLGLVDASPVLGSVSLFVRSKL